MRHLISGLLAVAAGTAAAQEAVTTPYDGSFEDATFAVESAIVAKGLVIDHVSHVGEMLARTGADLGSDTVIFEAADVFLFCSAVLSREVMEADPMNIAHCPYGIFVAVTHDKPDQTIVGFRQYPDGAMQEVQALLDGIVKAALGE